MVFDISRIFFRSIKGLRPTGIDVVTIRYVNRYQNKASFFIQRKGYFFFFPQKLSNEVAQIFVTKKSKIFYLRIIKLLILSIFNNIGKKKFKYIINLGHTGLENEKYINKVKSYSVKFVVLIHDLIPIRNPEFCTEDQGLSHKKRIKNAITYADKIFCVSNYVKNDVKKYADELNIALLSDIEVLHLGSSFEGKQIINSDHKISFSNFYLMVGTIEGRKRYDFVLEFWLNQIRQNKAVKNIVIVGQKGWKDSYVNELIKNEEIKDYLFILDDCDDNLLMNLYNDCIGVIFASEAEGFGLPLIDSIFFKKPIIANKLNVFSELAFNYPYYFNVKSQDSFHQSIVSSASFDYASRDKIQIPTWRNHFMYFETIINKLI